MSRTYRKQPICFCNNCNKPYTNNKTLRYRKDICECDYRMGYGVYIRSVKTQDSKPWYKPPRWFKDLQRRQERAQVQQALHNHIYKDESFTPPDLNKNSDQWEWI